MFIKVICVVLLGYMTQGINAGNSKEKVHIKVILPELVHKHTHKKIVYVKPKKSHLRAHPLAHEPLKHHSFENGFFNFFKHQSSSEPKKFFPKYTSGYHKIPARSLESLKNVQNTGPNVFGPNHYSYNTAKSEKYQTETIENPLSTDPFNKFIVKSSYKVREKLPYQQSTIGYDHDYESPLSEYEYDFHNAEPLVDDNKIKNDAYLHNSYEHELEKPPKQTNFQYKFPSNDYAYERNVALVDHYLNHNPTEGNPSLEDYTNEDPEKAAEYEYDFDKELYY